MPPRVLASGPKPCGGNKHEAGLPSSSLKSQGAAEQALFFIDAPLDILEHLCLEVALLEQLLPFSDTNIFAFSCYSI